MGERGEFVDKAGPANGGFGSAADTQNLPGEDQITVLAEWLLSARNWR
jgi:hypothetical protein